jgi:hypothetical protein
VRSIQIIAVVSSGEKNQLQAQAWKGALISGVDSAQKTEGLHPVVRAGSGLSLGHKQRRTEKLQEDPKPLYRRIEPDMNEEGGRKRMSLFQLTSSKQ